MAGSRRILLLVLFALPPCLASARADTPGDHPPAHPEVQQAMEAFLPSEVAGAVTAVASDQQCLHLGAVGWADLEARRPMQTDAIFWIASMTKPITATAVMMLHEQGKLSVDDPVAKYLPDLAELATADGRTATVTIEHLLTHTSGLAELPPGSSREIRTLAEVPPRIASRPLAFSPGSRWAYCQSGINTAARIVEVVSGESFPEFLDSHLFQPLGMHDTAFYLSDEQAARLARTYRRTDSGQLEETPLLFLQGKGPTSRDRYPMANGGLFSTASDYVRFCQMILREGELDGRRYLKPESVRLMTALHTGDLQTGFTPGNGWGLGWCVVQRPQGVTEDLSRGSFGHGGAYGTQAWLDPQNDRIYVLMVQRSNFPNSDASAVRKAFQAAAARALGSRASD